MKLIIKEKNGIWWTRTEVPIEYVKELIEGSREHIITENDIGRGMILRVE